MAEGARLVAAGGSPKGMEGFLFKTPSIFTFHRRHPHDAHRAGGSARSGAGLAAGRCSRDINRTHRVDKDLFAGTVWIKTYRTSAAQAPRRGYRLSGHSRECDRESLLGTRSHSRGTAAN